MGNDDTNVAAPHHGRTRDDSSWLDSALANADGERNHIHRREDFDTAGGISLRVAVQRKAWRLIRIVARLSLFIAFAGLVVLPLVPLYDI
jgi:hypothetical protein